MKQIIVIKPGTLSLEDKKKLTKEGNIVIEHERPTEIVYRQKEEPYTFTNCLTCGDRIYMRIDLHEAFKKNKNVLCCPQGHQQVFK